MENPARGGAPDCRTGKADASEFTRKTLNPQAAARVISAEAVYKAYTNERVRRLAGPRFERRIERLHRLGPRVLAEMLGDIPPDGAKDFNEALIAEGRECA